MDTASPTHQLGPYALGGTVAQTATSHVYAGVRQDAQPPEPLVIKVFSASPPGLLEAVVERAGVLSSLGSPHLVPVVDAAFVDGKLTVVRPRQRALTLAELTERARAQRRVMPASLCVRIIHDVFTALEAAHGHEHPQWGGGWLSHGEVAPAHILVDDTGRTLLLGTETPRGPSLQKPAPVRHDLTGTMALLYELMPQRRTGTEGMHTLMASIPPEFATLLTEAMGLRGSLHSTAEQMKAALMAAAGTASIALGTWEEVAVLYRRLTDGAPPQVMTAAVPGEPPPPATKAPPPELPSAGIFASPRPVSGLIEVMGTPLEASPAGASAAPKEGAAANAGLVLLVDPDPPGAQKISARLEAEGFNVVTAWDGESALHQLKTSQPHVIISDVTLPGVGGLDILRSVRGQEALKEVPVFLVSVTASDQENAAALEAGADDYLGRPVGLDVLAGKVKRAVARYRSVLSSRAEVAAARKDARATAQRRPTSPGARAEPTGVIGTLKQMGVVEIVQSLEMGRKTAVVSLMFPAGGEGSLWVVDGEVVNAALGATQGAEAFYAMARRGDGYFRIHYGEPPDVTPQMSVATSFLVLEAMRRMDEERAP